MSESEAQRSDSPLLTERGATIIGSAVVSSIAGMAAQEVEGVHMGGGATRTASGVIGSITGSEGKTGGVTVEVGRSETAIDLKMGIEYNRNILQTVEEVRRRITERVESMTGLRIKELNATITDITFPEQGARRRLAPPSPTSDREGDTEQATATAPETQATPESETGDPGEIETTQVESTRAETATGAPAEYSGEPEEAAGVEDRPPEERETAEVPAGEATTEQPTEEASETVETAETDETTEKISRETETPEEPETRPDLEPETPETRIRRRAEERARRRRSQDS